jgi:hypothetical protein
MSTGPEGSNFEYCGSVSGRRVTNSGDDRDWGWDQFQEVQERLAEGCNFVVAISAHLSGI